MSEAEHPSRREREVTVDDADDDPGPLHVLEKAQTQSLALVRPFDEAGDVGAGLARVIGHPPRSPLQHVGARLETPDAEIAVRLGTSAADVKGRIQQLKEEMAERLLSLPADEVYDADLG